MRKKRVGGIRINLSREGSSLSAAGYSKIEEGMIYDALLIDVIENPRWYIDSSTYLPEFKLSWVNYKYSRGSLPLKHVNQRKVYKEKTTI